MNVEREFAAANRRVQALIDQRADEALIRLGFDPDAERDAAARAAAAEQGEVLGRAWRSLVDGLAAFGRAFNRGFNGGAS